MINRRRNIKGKEELPTILMLVENTQGALRAGQFVFSNLYTPQTRVILLQTYRVQGFGMGLVRNLSQILKEIALDELTMIKNRFIEEFGIPSENLHKVAFEGDLGSILKERYCKPQNLTIVIGEEQNLMDHETPYKQLSTVLESSCADHIFYLNENMTYIDPSKILIVSEKTEDVSVLYRKYITELSKKHKRMLEYNSANGQVKVINYKDTVFDYKSGISLVNKKVISAE